MTTFGTLKTRVSEEELRDPNQKTFSGTTVGEMILAGLVEVGRIAPQRYQEDIAPVDGQLAYVLRSDEFLGIAQPEIELVRVEVWDTTTTPARFVTRCQPAAGEYENSSPVGWRVWGGKLEITNNLESWLDPALHLVRVWGYSPYVLPDSDDDIIPVSQELERAVRDYCRVQALRRLNQERDLFTQWQTRSGNSDISPAGLMNQLAQAEDQWRRQEKHLFVLRQNP